MAKLKASPLETAAADLAAVWIKRNQLQSELAKIERELDGQIQRLVGLERTAQKARDEG